MLNYQRVVYISLSYLGLCSVQLPAFGTGRVNLRCARPHSRRLAAGEWEKTNPIYSYLIISSYLILSYRCFKNHIMMVPYIDLLNINQYKLYTLNHMYAADTPRMMSKNNNVQLEIW